MADLISALSDIVDSINLDIFGMVFGSIGNSLITGTAGGFIVAAPKTIRARTAVNRIQRLQHLADPVNHHGYGGTGYCSGTDPATHFYTTSHATGSSGDEDVISA